MLATATASMAGGFAIREQSAQFQGSAFAGAAAGGGLSSMYWNPAAAGTVVGPGIIMESHYSLIMGYAEHTVDTFTPGAAVPAPVVAALPFLSKDSGDIAPLALVGASYVAYNLSPNLTAAMSLTSGFGLTTKPDKFNYLGAQLAQTTSLLTINAAPTLAYKIMPGVTVGAGVQIQYATAKFSFASGAPIGQTSAFRKADDVGFGATAGILLEPMAGTSIGLGYRSNIKHKLEGEFSFSGGAYQKGASAELDLPEIVTLSLRQAVAPNARLLGTVEWTNWSRFEQLKLDGTTPAIPAIPANWSDGWFFALGGEYDLNPTMTLRAGVAYEISPVDDPTKRLTSIPDNNRVWLSAGGSIKLTETMSADFAYTHVFVENGEFDRETSNLGPGSVSHITGHTEAHVDIFSVGIKSRW
ncbi:MAG: outer membrane protein transport protein [Hyphomicrobium sp.]